MIFTSLLVWAVTGVLWLCGMAAVAVAVVGTVLAERIAEWLEPVPVDGDGDGDGPPRPRTRHRLVGVAGATRHDEFGRVLLPDG